MRAAAGTAQLPPLLAVDPQRWKAPPMSSPTLSETISMHVLKRLQKEVGLEEIFAEGTKDKPYLSVVPPAGPFAGTETCQLRVIRGKAKSGVSKVVYNRLYLPQMGMDAHMVFAFTDKNSPVPHFTLDAVRHPGKDTQHAFHLDLIPRLDLGSDIEYLDESYGPLTKVREEFVKANEKGLFEAALTLRQYAVMSPWMLANQASDATFKALTPVADAFISQWLALLKKGYSKDLQARLDKIDHTVRDRRHRQRSFQPRRGPRMGPGRADCGQGDQRARAKHPQGSRVGH